VTSLVADHHAALEELLGPARQLGFTVPHEAAVHLHLDGAPFRRPHALANVVRLFAHWREALRTVLQTNPACRRLAPLPEPLVTAARGAPSSKDLRRAAVDGGLTKFFDVNLTQLLTDTPVNRAGIVELLLDREPFPAPPADPGTAVSALLSVAAEVLAGRHDAEAVRSGG
jgi:hypothetical protein